MQTPPPPSWFCVHSGRQPYTPRDYVLRVGEDMRPAEPGVSPPPFLLVVVCAEWAPTRMRHAALLSVASTCTRYMITCSE